MTTTSQTPCINDLDNSYYKFSDHFITTTLIYLTVNREVLVFLNTEIRNFFQVPTSMAKAREPQKRIYDNVQASTDVQKKSDAAQKPLSEF